jgi:hypothetical protein
VTDFIGADAVVPAMLGGPPVVYVELYNADVATLDVSVCTGLKALICYEKSKLPKKLRNVKPIKSALGYLYIL